MTQRTYRLAVLPGDGIGREVVTEGLKVLAAVAPIAGVRYELAEYPFGADHYLATRELLAPSAVEEMRRTDAVYFGAIGDPRVPPGVLEHGVLLGLVRALDLYVNVRPIRLYAAGLSPLAGKRPEDVDFVIVRETTEDCFSPDVRVLHRDSEHEVAIGQMVYTRRGTERAMRFAFDLARRPGRRGRVTNVHQANAIGAHGLLHRTFEAVAAQSPGVAARRRRHPNALVPLLRSNEGDLFAVGRPFGNAPFRREFQRPYIRLKLLGEQAAVQEIGADTCTAHILVRDRGTGRRKGRPKFRSDVRRYLRLLAGLGVDGPDVRVIFSVQVKYLPPVARHVSYG
jgi:hypothetical protein